MARNPVWRKFVRKTSARNKIGMQVVAALRQMADALAEGALLTIGPQRTRVRVLPLNPV